MFRAEPVGLAAFVKKTFPSHFFSKIFWLAASLNWLLKKHAITYGSGGNPLRFVNKPIINCFCRVAQTQNNVLSKKS